MTDRQNSISDDIDFIKRKADEILRPFWIYGYCDDCGDRLHLEQGHPGDLHEPPSETGFYCMTCQEFKK